MYEAYLMDATKRIFVAYVKNGLVEYQERDRTFIITEKGIHFLKIHNELNELIATKQIDNDNNIMYGTTILT
jgi:predicted transcriptional regulator